MLLRTLRPRRLENAINYVLTLILVCMLIYFYQKLGFIEPSRLPTEPGHTWPTTTIAPHTKPRPGAVRTGLGEQGKAVVLEGKARVQGQNDIKKWFMNVSLEK